MAASLWGALALLTLGSCSRNLDLPEAPEPIRVEVFAYVDAVKGVPALVDVRGIKDDGSLTVPAGRQRAETLRLLDFLLPQDATRFTPGPWTFTIQFYTPSGVPRSKVECHATLRFGEQKRIHAFEDSSECDVESGAKFAGGYDVEVFRLSVNPRNPIPAASTVNVFLRNRGSASPPPFNVRVAGGPAGLASPPEIATRPGPDLASPGPLAIPWDTTGLVPGAHDVQASVTDPMGSPLMGDTDASNDARGISVDLTCANDTTNDPTDTDGDLVRDACDTCPYHPNPTQTDASACRDLKIVFWPNTDACRLTPVWETCANNCNVLSTDCIQVFGEGFDAGQTAVTVGGRPVDTRGLSVCDGGTRLVFPGGSPAGPAGVPPNDPVVVTGPGTATSPVPNYCDPGTLALTPMPPCTPGPRAFTPISARRGESVYVFGCGFDPAVSYRVQIGVSHPAPAQFLNRQLIRFSVPPLARSGRIKVLLPNNAPFGPEPARFFKVDR